MKTVGVAEAKAKFSELLGRVAHGGERIIVHRRGKAVAALVPIADLPGVNGEPEHDWLDDIVGLCSDCPEVCDSIDQVVAERQREMPTDVRFPWEDDDSPRQ
jgi:prevent-host-death family protein